MAAGLQLLAAAHADREASLHLTCPSPCCHSNNQRKPRVPPAWLQAAGGPRGEILPSASASAHRELPRDPHLLLFSGSLSAKRRGDARLAESACSVAQQPRLSRSPAGPAALLPSVLAEWAVSRHERERVCPAAGFDLGRRFHHTFKPHETHAYLFKNHSPQSSTVTLNHKV